jgi:hypothetical protein
MGKSLKDLLLSYKDAGAACANGGGVFVLTTTPYLIIKALTGFNINEYNLVGHATAAAGAGTYAYRRVKTEVTEATGDERKGTKWGIVAGLTAGIVLSTSWEYWENKGHIFEPKANPFLDTMLDHLVMLITSGGLVPAIELELKPYLKRKLPE